MKRNGGHGATRTFLRPENTDHPCSRRPFNTPSPSEYKRSNVKPYNFFVSLC